MQFGIIHIKGCGSYLINLKGNIHVTLFDKEGKQINFDGEVDTFRMYSLNDVSEICIHMNELRINIPQSSIPGHSKRFSVSKPLDIALKRFLDTVKSTTLKYINGLPSLPGLQEAIEKIDHLTQGGSSGLISIT